MAWNSTLTDVLTEAETKTALSIPTAAATYDDALNVLVSGVSLMLDEVCGPIVQRTVTSEIHNGGGVSIRLRRAPVATIATIDEADGTTVTTLTRETFGTTPTSGYYVDPWPTNPALYGPVVFRRSGGLNTFFAYGKGNIRVTYTAGRAATTSAVDRRFKRAAILCVKNLWRDMQAGIGSLGEFDLPAATFPTYALPKAAIDILAGEIEPPVGV